MMTAQSLINIGGKVYEASSLELPPSGRALRGAWTGGPVVEVDMAVAKDIHIRKLMSEADEKARAAEEKQKFFSAKGDTAAADAEAAKVKRFRAVPSGPAQTAINSATTDMELLAVTLDEFLP